MRFYSTLRLCGLALFALTIGTGCFGSKNRKINALTTDKAQLQLELTEMTDLRDDMAKEADINLAEVMSLQEDMKGLEQNIIDMGKGPLVVPGKYWKSIDSCKERLSTGADFSVATWTLEGTTAHCKVPALAPGS